MGVVEREGWHEILKVSDFLGLLHTGVGGNALTAEAQTLLLGLELVRTLAHGRYCGSGL